MMTSVTHLQKLWIAGGNVRLATANCARRFDLLDADLVVAIRHLSEIKFIEEMRQVVGKEIVIVDHHQRHGSSSKKKPPRPHESGWLTPLA
jgi:hypothetical protein